MGMFEDFKSMRNDLFNAFEDFIETTATIKDDPQDDYNLATASNSITYATEETLKVFLRDYTQDQISGEILAGDVLAKVNIEDLSIDLKPSSIVIIGTDIYKVVSVKPLPKTNPVIIDLQLRGKKNA